MSPFESSKIYPTIVPDLTPVAQEVMEHFKRQGYDVRGEQTIMQGWHISISKGGLFKAVLGMKTAMNIEITPWSGGTSAKAGIGIFGLQAIPTAISVFLFWPVLLPQIWGMVRQSKLDDQALSVIERSLQAQTSGAATEVAGSPSGGTPGETAFCTNCGASIAPSAKFCPECGTNVGAAAVPVPDTP